MDGMTGGAASPNASRRLRAEAVSLRESAERDQIEPGGTLGHWLRGQETALLALADLADHIDQTAARLDERVHAVIKNTRELSVSEVHRLQQATALAEETTRSLQATEVVVNLRTQQAMTLTIDAMRADLVQALRGATVIREQSWNRRQNVMGVTVMSCMLIGLLGLGYVVGGGDFRSRSAGDRAQAAVARCIALASSGPSPATSWCDLSVLAEPGG